MKVGALAMVVLVLPACGGDGDAGPGATAAATTTGKGGNSRSVPARLIGTYTTTLQPRDIPANAPPELTDAGFSWTLRIEETGGPDGGPYLAIDSDELGNLEAPALRVHGDRLLLLQEECASPTGTKFYDNEYRWSMSGQTLEIEAVRNKCPDRVAETILTSHPWTKTG